MTPLQSLKIVHDDRNALKAGRIIPATLTYLLMSIGLGCAVSRPGKKFRGQKASRRPLVNIHTPANGVRQFIDGRRSVLVRLSAGKSGRKKINNSDMLAERKRRTLLRCKVFEECYQRQCIVVSAGRICFWENFLRLTNEPMATVQAKRIANFVVERSKWFREEDY